MVNRCVFIPRILSSVENPDRGKMTPDKRKEILCNNDLEMSALTPALFLPKSGEVIGFFNLSELDFEDIEFYMLYASTLHIDGKLRDSDILDEQLRSQYVSFGGIFLPDAEGEDDMNYLLGFGEDEDWLDDDF